MADQATAEFPFLTRLFQEWNSHAINYAVLRNADTLPDSVNGGDVDILINAMDFKRACGLLYSVTAQCGGSVYAEADSPDFKEVMLFGKCENQWWGVCLDLFSGVYYKAAMPMVSNEILDHRVQTKKGVYTLPKELADLLGVVKEFAYNGVLAERYRPGAIQACEKFDLSCFECCGKRGFALLKTILVSSRYSRSQVTRYRRFLFFEAIKNGVLMFCGRTFRFYFAKIRRYLCPPGRMVAILGTDGAGKSTILAEMSPLLKEVTHKAMVIHHLKPDFLPSLSRLKGENRQPRGPVTNPHGSKPSGFLLSFCRFLYLLMDYVFGYWVKVRPFLAKVPVGLYIFDRYAYDIALDPRRFRIRLPPSVIMRCLKIVPAPDLVICLGASPDLIHRRKPELPLNEVHRQVDALRRFSSANNCAVWVDTGCELNVSVNAVLTALKAISPTHGHEGL